MDANDTSVLPPEGDRHGRRAAEHLTAHGPQTGGSCHGGGLHPRLSFARQPSTRTIVDESGASILALDTGIWAVISKPLGGGSDTLSSGGVVVGGDQVLVFDGFARPAGGALEGLQLGPSGRSRDAAPAPT